MQETDILVIGGGPAGLAAAASASGLGAKVTLVDRNSYLGGQLVKQTHKFFGSQKQYAGFRGGEIAQKLIEKIKNKNENVQVSSKTTVIGAYDDGVFTVERDNTLFKYLPKRVIVATGAAEKFLPFPNSDLPGVCGAGAVQTLMNLYAVRPGHRVLMVGAGNIGLIVSYQLLQAGVRVEAIIDGAPRIGGYQVHAAKVLRAGVPIYTRHTIVQALGSSQVECALISEVDECWQPISKTKKQLDVDVICLAVGLSPLTEILWQLGCEMTFVPVLGGYIPWHNDYLQTSKSGIYVAGDVAGVEEASSAMVEGTLAGASAAHSLGYNNSQAEAVMRDSHDQLQQLRSGPMGQKIREGLNLLTSYVKEEGA